MTGTCDVQAAGMIELFFYGELSSIERAAVQSHLKQCADCRRVLDDLSLIRAALASRPDVATPPGGNWSGFMARLDRSIRERPEPLHVEAAQSSWRRLTFRWQPYVAAAAVVVLVTAGVLSVVRQRNSASTAVPQTQATLPAPAQEPPARAAEDPALVTLSDRHFERSKLVVLGLTTKDASRNEESTWAYERDLATTLLGDTRLYRRAAEERGMNRLAGVMRDLELVLLQTSMSEQPDRQSLEQLQRLIRRRDLLTKMNAVYTGP